jgi:hypothetical protein
MLSAVLDRLRRLAGSESGSDGTDPSDDGGPDLYECEGCGAVFISRPDQCSTCEDDDFSNVGKFER